MLFTIILEFEGTTSVSQFSARNVGEAYRSWFQGLKDLSRYGLDANQAERLASALSFDGLQPPTALVSTENVWCISTHVDESYALLNFVATVAAVHNRTARITAVTTSNERVVRKRPRQRSNQIDKLTASAAGAIPSSERKSRESHGTTGYRPVTAHNLKPEKPPLGG
jgi:hypothetical protein